MGFNSGFKRLIVVCFGMLAYCNYKVVVLNRCLPMASWDVTLTRSVALGASDEKQVIKVRYTFVFKQRFNVCSETRSDFILNMDAVLSLKRKSNQQ